MCAHTAVPEKLDFELKLALVGTESWIHTPKHLFMWNGGMNHGHPHAVRMVPVVETIFTTAPHPTKQDAPEA